MVHSWTATPNSLPTATTARDQVVGGGTQTSCIYALGWTGSNTARCNAN